MSGYVPRHGADRPHPPDRHYVPRHAAPRPTRRRGPFGAALPFALAIVAVVAVAVSGVVVLNRDGEGGEATAGPAPGSGDAAGIPAVERPARPAGPGAPRLELVAPSPPVRVVIPSIEVDSGLETLDLGDDGKLAAPRDYRSAGWFAAGTQPGQPGPSVIAGHVDSTDGPAVFARLDELEVGGEVQVVREDGSAVRFLVAAMETFPKDEFPTASVYGPVPGPELRLITCDGLFDRSTGHYVDNLVVYAVAADTPSLVS